MAAASDVVRSQIETAALPMRLWQGFADEGARIVDLRDVSFWQGRLVLHGVAPAEAPTLRQVLRPYQHFIKGDVTSERFDDVFELSPEPLRWSECARIEERCTLFLSPWHIDNAFHLHCDNLLPAFANLHLGGLLDAPRLLYLFEGDPARNARAVQLWALMAGLFDGAVESVTALRASPGRIGFRRIRWGRGPALPYLPEVRGTPYEGAVDAYRAWALRHLGIAERQGPAAEAAPRLLYVDRLDARRIVNPEILVEAFADLGHNLRVFGEWGTVGIRDLVALAHGADVLLGVKGAALAHMIYQPRGSLVVELSRGSHYLVPVWRYLASLCGHRLVPFDLPRSGESHECILSRPVAAGIARAVLNEWQQRKRPMPAWKHWFQLARSHAWRLRRFTQRIRARRRP